MNHWTPSQITSNLKRYAIQQESFGETDSISHSALQSLEVKRLVTEAIRVAIHNLGTKAVLDALPLNITEVRVTMLSDSSILVFQ